MTMGPNRAAHLEVYGFSEFQRYLEISRAILVQFLVRPKIIRNSIQCKPTSSIKRTLQRLNTLNSFCCGLFAALAAAPPTTAELGVCGVCNVSCGIVTTFIFDCWLFGTI